MADSDGESDWGQETHELYPYGELFENVATILREPFIEVKDEVRIARGGKLDQIAIDMLREYVRALVAVTRTFPANWDEDLRRGHDPSMPPEERARQLPGRFDAGRLDHYERMHAIYLKAEQGIIAANRAFKEKKEQGLAQGLLHPKRDAEWTEEISDSNQKFYQRNYVHVKNLELQVLWLKEHGETAEFDKEKMKEFWRQRQETQPVRTETTTVQTQLQANSEKPRKSGFFKKLFK